MRLLILISFVFFLLFSGCDNDMENGNNQPIKTETELGILPKLISLPKQPLQVKWEIDEQKSTNAGSLIALLQYSISDYNSIIKNSLPFEANIKERMESAFYKKWVPREIRETINTVPVDNNMLELQNIYSLQPNLFTQTQLSPFVHGSITPLGQGYILISLYSL
ncbi:MAG: hypothetical protein D6B27_02045 [Gammaproteobacteria bacterium]|nr:MAG: hypothetical protein D6B27_02045 [Gammaproteobacteria bacterium]